MKRCGEEREESQTGRPGGLRIDKKPGLHRVFGEKCIPGPEWRFHGRGRGCEPYTVTNRD